MCGIVGVINGKGTSAAVSSSNWFRDAMLAGIVRGQDSVGVFQVMDARDHEPIYYDKTTESAEKFLDTKFGSSIANDAGRGFITIGHHRAATRGAVTQENAHPFLVERDDKSSFIGVHNGTLTKFFNQEDGKKFGVDSEWGIYALSKNVKTALEEFEGAFVFAFYDSNTPSKFYLATNNQRPIYWAFEQGRNSMLLASEGEMLAWLAKRNNIQLRDKAVYAGMPNSLYTFDYEDVSRYVKTEFTPKPSTWYSKTSNTSTTQGPMTKPVVATPSAIATSIREIVDKVRRMTPEQYAQETNEAIVSTNTVITKPVLTTPPPAPSTPLTAQMYNVGVTRDQLIFMRDTLAVPYNKEASFVADGWDELSRTITGIVEVADTNDMKETYVAEVRGISKERWRALQDEASLAVRCVGAELFTKAEGGQDIRVLCRCPIVESVKTAVAGGRRM